MAVQTVAPSAAVVAGILDSDEVAALIAELDALHWTGRRGYGARTLVGACLVKSLYAIPTWTRTARLIDEHSALRDALGGAPSEWACYRFAKKLREHKPLLDACLGRVVASLRSELPEMGENIAIDGSDLAAYANGRKSLSKRKPDPRSDPDASWGRRSSISTRNSGSFFGFKIHAAVCARTGLPLAWRIATGKAAEGPFSEWLLSEVGRRGFKPQTCAMDKGYDHGPIHGTCIERGIAPIIPIRVTRTSRDLDAVRECEHGRWTFAGADFGRKATKWRCPTGECDPKSMWVKASRRHPLIPRDSKRFRELYCGRSAVEREFGRLKHEYGLAPLRVRGVALHADLTMLARLSLALARARAVPLAA